MADGREKMESLKQAVTMLMGSIEKTTELFYTQKEAEGYQAFGLLLTPLTTVIDSVYQMQQAGGTPEFDLEKLTGILTDAMNAMEARDGVLLADILQYDFLDEMNAIAKQLAD